MYRCLAVVPSFVALALVAGSAGAASGQRPPVEDILGEPRPLEELAPFVGQYGDPEAQERPRNLFAAVRCDGYLMVGATWGDASNWHLRSLSDSEFQAVAFGGDTIRFSFDRRSDGTPLRMHHTLEYFESPLERVGGLPEGWSDDCVPPSGG